MNSIKNILIHLYNKYLLIYRFLYRKVVTPKIPVNKDEKVYVNLGCGMNTSFEFINVDTRTLPNIHYIAEIQKLPMFKDNSVDFLYASHLVEHISRNELLDTIKEWYRVLKLGGKLRIGVPDFDALIEIYKLSGNNIDSIINQLMGQNSPYDDHHTIWNFVYAKSLLEKVGFKDIKLWSYNTAEHHDFHDKSGREVIIKDRKILISLNIEATK